MNNKEIEDKYSDVTIILPSYNEEDSIAKVISDVNNAMDSSGYNYNIIVVDDCSIDNTASIAEDMGVNVIRHNINLGSGNARKTGISNAKSNIIVMLDADGTYEASDIPKMLSYFPKYDQVNGARTSEQGTMKIFRIIAKWFIRKLASYLTKVEIPDLNTGLKAFKKDIMLNYFWIIPDGFSCVSTMTLTFLIDGYKVKFIPTKYHSRIGKSKFRPISDSLNYFITVIRIIMYFKPLNIILPLSFILLLSAMISSVYHFFQTSSIQESDIIIFIFSILIFFVGFISDLIITYSKR